MIKGQSYKTGICNKITNNNIINANIQDNLLNDTNKSQCKNNKDGRVPNLKAFLTREQFKKDYMKKLNEYKENNKDKDNKDKDNKDKDNKDNSKFKQVNRENMLKKVNTFNPTSTEDFNNEENKELFNEKT